MEEKVNLTDTVIPQTEEENLLSGGGDTTPNPEQDGKSYLEIKFNKELIELDRESAVTLAQKGMKFDLISDEYERLKTICKRQGKDVNIFLAECESNEMMSSNDSSYSTDFDKFRQEFPEITSLDMLPEEVKTAAEIKGTGLIFEYLLFEHKLQKAKADEEKNREFAALSSTGSLSKDDRTDPTASEFIKGVWGK